MMLQVVRDGLVDSVLKTEQANEAEETAACGGERATPVETRRVKAADARPRLGEGAPLSAEGAQPQLFHFEACTQGDVLCFNSHLKFEAGWQGPNSSRAKSSRSAQIPRTRPERLPES